MDRRPGLHGPILHCRLISHDFTASNEQRQTNFDPDFFFLITSTVLTCYTNLLTFYHITEIIILTIVLITKDVFVVCLSVSCLSL